MTTLIVVSDDPQVISAAGQLTGYEVVVLRDPSEGLLKYNRRADIALLDMTFPDVTSMYDVIQKYIDHNCEILLIGELHQQAEIAEFLHRGVDDFLLKPLNSKLLKWRLNRLLEMRQISLSSERLFSEITTPLTPIKGFTDMLLMRAAGDLTEMQNRFLNSIKTNIDLVLLVRRNCYRESALFRERANCHPVDVKPVIEQALPALTEQLGFSGIELHISIEPDLPFVLSTENVIAYLLDAIPSFGNGRSREIHMVVSGMDEVVLLSIEPVNTKADDLLLRQMNYLAEKFSFSMFTGDAKLLFSFTVMK